MEIEREKLSDIIKRLDEEVTFDSPSPSIFSGDIKVNWGEVVDIFEEECEVCGGTHIDSWEANACWEEENDPDYDPFDI